MAARSAGIARRRAAVLAAAVVAAALARPAAAASHNLILFVPDGLRAAVVDAKSAPTFARVRDEGVDFVNSHALFPTFTTANASAFATGHLLGDTGDFSNTIFTGFALASAGGSMTPFLENDAVLREMNSHFGGNYLNELSILDAAQQAGWQTAAIGKRGPAAIQALAALGGSGTLIVDDGTGRTGGVPLAARWADAFRSAGLDLRAPGRGANGRPGNLDHPGTRVANVAQQRYFVDVTTRVVLPRFKASGKAFVLVFWSRDPDGTQHNQGDSPNKLVPGINGPTSAAAIRNADSNLAEILKALRALDLTATTDVVVAADHGFSTISKRSRTSAAAAGRYSDVTADELPPGFVAIDLAAALQRDDPRLKLFDAAGGRVVDWKAGQHPRRGTALIGRAAAQPAIVVVANGGSDLIYLPGDEPRKRLRRIVGILLGEDYVSGLFADAALGRPAGTLPLSAIGLAGSALTPRPALVVNFASTSTGCARPVRCAVEIADTGLQQGQGMHGSFSRADTWNFMAAVGPDFRRHYVDRMPASNADIAMTIAQILKLRLPHKGKLLGRVLGESLRGGEAAPFHRRTRVSARAPNGLRTVLKEQSVGATRYFDAAGFAGRSVGLPPLEFSRPDPH